MREYHELDWNFLNMNSPADLFAEYKDDGVHLNEYDRCRDGHALVSRFYLEKENIEFSTKVVELGAGIGIGLYYGDGCFKDYLLICVDHKEVSVRVPNGVPQGDTFRMEGPKRYYTIASASRQEFGSFTIGIKKKQDEFSVMIQDEVVIRMDCLRLPFSTEGKRIKVMVKALNEDGVQPKSKSVFRGFFAEGIQECFDLKGICMDCKLNNGMSNVYVHVLGEYKKWAKTNENGEFVVEGMPLGKYRLSFAKEGKDFQVLDGIHDGGQQIYTPDFSELVHQRESHPQENLKNNLPHIGLNGVWKFEFDKQDVGEKEGWFGEGKHDYSHCIRVPFSWQSLNAFGEEELMDEYSLHQANSFTSNSREIGEIGWYQRSFYVDDFGVDDFYEGSESELVIGAISGVSKIWLDEELIGCTTDSYEKSVFSLGILKPQQEYRLTIKVNYEHGNNWACSGKQGFWFTDSPGIWQNVWLRKREELSVKELLIDYNFTDEKEVEINFLAEMSTLSGAKIMAQTSNNCLSFQLKESGNYKISINYSALYETECEIVRNGHRTGTRLIFDSVHGDYFDKKEYYCYLNKGDNRVDFLTETEEFIVLGATVEEVKLQQKVELWFGNSCIGELQPKINRDKGSLECKAHYHLKEARIWKPSDPFHYPIKIRIKSGDSWTEYTRGLGIRKVASSELNSQNSSYITINNQKTYIRGVLDQGYNPWGLYTYPRLRGQYKGSAEFDINAAKEFGYNLIRMHIKDNEPDWYDICDETGMLVWDEVPCNFYGTAEDRHWQSMYMRALKNMVKKHNYHSSVILCSTINESWGITGDHEKSPWDKPLGQSLIKGYAKYYKSHNYNALVIDNSGYGKTSETQVIDHHAYPLGYEDARDFFERLSHQNYPGSHFNFYNRKNKDLMLDHSIRDLLQRNCSQNLSTISHTGDDIQSGQPVLISEFVHTDKQEELVRMFPGFAGYIRMNIASQENEDTSPLTAGRNRRDFGFVRDDFSKASYKIANSENMIYMDYPFLSKIFEGDELEIDLYASLWEEGLSEIESIQVEWKFIGIDAMGYYKETDINGTFCVNVTPYQPFLIQTIKMKVPQAVKGGYLFVKIISKEEMMSYVQFEIFERDSDFVNDKSKVCSLELDPSDIMVRSGFDYSDIFEKDNRNVIWGYGKGTIAYQKTFLHKEFTKAVLILELSDCLCLQGTRETDESLKESDIQLYIQDKFVKALRVKEQSCDKRAIFSNSSSSEERISNYSRTGIYGYGSRVEIDIPVDIIERIKEESAIRVKLVSADTGIMIYGNRMGSHGSNPMIVLT